MLTHMSRRVVIPESLCAPETLEQRVRRQHHLLDPLNAAAAFFSARDGSDVLHDPLRRLGLPRTGLSRDDHALVLLLGGHLVVSRLGNGEDVGRHLEPVLASVRLQRLLGVDAEVCTSADGRLQPAVASELDPPRKGLTEMSTWAIYVLRGCQHQYRPSGAIHSRRSLG